MNPKKAMLISGAAVAGAGLLCAGTTAAVVYGWMGRRAARRLSGPPEQESFNPLQTGEETLRFPPGRHPGTR